MNNSNTTTAKSHQKNAIDLANLRINHSRIKELRGEVQSLIYPNSQSNILLIVGPTGVGKSTLTTHLVESALSNHRSHMDSDANLIPAVYVQAPASGEKEFSWRLLYERILGQLEDDRLGLSKHAIGIDENTKMLVRPKRTGSSNLAGLRTAVERALRQRATQFLVIDEAAHIFMQTSDKQMGNHMNTLKSLANECGTQIVLAGSYDLYNFVSKSAQLARRTHVIHFERYRQDVPEDVRAFTTCVKQFEATLPELWQGQLTPHTLALMENTLGCVGTLSRVLTKAARIAEAAGNWSIDMLQRTLLTEAQVVQILEETTNGEVAINPCLTRTMPTHKRA